MGIIYRVEWVSRTQAWNVSERKCIIDQSRLRDVVLFLPNAEMGDWEKTIAFTKSSIYAVLE